MERTVFRFKPSLPRAWVFGAAFVTSMAWLAVVLAAFHAVSGDDWLYDSPAARVAVARCDALSDRAARRACVRELVVAARSRDAGQYQLALTASMPAKALR
jgi:hypothetical protein